MPLWQRKMTKNKLYREKNPDNFGFFFSVMIQSDPDKLSIIDGRMTVIRGQSKETPVSHGKHKRNEWKLKFPLAFTKIHRYNDHSFKILLN